MLLDTIEKIPICIFFVQYIYINYHNIFCGMNIVLILYSIEQCLDVFFIISRRPGKVSRRKIDWILAFLGTYPSLLVSTEPGGMHIIPSYLCVVLSLSGLFISLSAKIFLGRNFGIVAACRSVATYGPYRFVRHPMYFGYVVTNLSFLLNNFQNWNLFCFILGTSLQVMRAEVEERTLNQNAEWKEWSNHVRWKMVPFLY